MELIGAIMNNALVGVIVGFVLNMARDWWYNRNRLYYSLKAEEPYEDWEPEKARKYDPSGYILEVYNCGKNPVIIDNVSLRWENSIIDSLESETVTILPYHSHEIILAEQDYGAIRRWGELAPNLEEVDVVAHTVSGNRVKGKLNLGLIKLQFGLR